MPPLVERGGCFVYAKFFLGVMWASHPTVQDSSMLVVGHDAHIVPLFILNFNNHFFLYPLRLFETPPLDLNQGEAGICARHLDLYNLLCFC